MMLFAPNKTANGRSQKKVLNTELGTITIYNNIVIMEAKENVTISIKTGLFILLDVVKMVGTKPIVYISHRLNSYSVNPNDYKYLDMIPNLKGIAIVCYSEQGNRTAEFEEAFIHKPFKVFGNLMDAKRWSYKILDKPFIESH